MSRKASFKEGKSFQVLKVKDSRFGKRKMYLNDKERPSIFSYDRPGKGVNGEHQNQFYPDLGTIF